MVNLVAWKKLHKELSEKNVTLIAVSKTKPVADIQELYDFGQRQFGENYVQELTEKHKTLPDDINWHYIGHLQRKNVKIIASFVTLIHAVDSFKLLLEINKHALLNNRTIDILLQMHIAREETKYGMDEKEVIECLQYYEAQKDNLKNIRICGLMGMATNTEDTAQIHKEYVSLYAMFKNLSQSDFLGKDYFSICSMGMSNDYEIAIEEGSNMVRIGSLLFGERNYGL